MEGAYYLYDSLDIGETRGETDRTHDGETGGGVPLLPSPRVDLLLPGRVTRYKSSLHTTDLEGMGQVLQVEDGGDV